MFCCREGAEAMASFLGIHLPLFRVEGLATDRTLWAVLRLGDNLSCLNDDGCLDLIEDWSVEINFRLFTL